MAINLVPRKIREERQEQFWKKSTLWGGIAVLLGVGAISLGILIFQLFLQRELSQLADEISSEKQQIRARQEIELKLRDLGIRAEAVPELLKDGNYYSRLLEKLTLLLPEEVTFSRLQVSGPDSVSLSGNAFSYIDLARFIEAIQDEEEMLAGLQLRAVNLDAQTGQISFELKIDIIEEKLHGI